MKNPTFASRWNADLIDQKYEIWQQDPSQLDAEWRAFFEGFALAQEYPKKKTTSTGGVSSHDARLQAKTAGAIYAYRNLGHTEAKLDPLSETTNANPRLDLKTLGLSENDFACSYIARFKAN